MEEAEDEPPGSGSRRDLATSVVRIGAWVQGILASVLRTQEGEGFAVAASFWITFLGLALSNWYGTLPFRSESTRDDDAGQGPARELRPLGRMADEGPLTEFDQRG